MVNSKEASASDPATWARDWFLEGVVLQNTLARPGGGGGELTIRIAGFRSRAKDNHVCIRKEPICQNIHGQPEMRPPGPESAFHPVWPFACFLGKDEEGYYISHLEGCPFQHSPAYSNI